MVGEGNAPAPADSSTSPAAATGARISSRSSSALAAVSIVLILLYLFWRFLWQCKKHAAGNANATIETTSRFSSASPPPSCSSRTASRAGAEARHETPSSSLPVFVHMAAQGTEKAECAVCLVEFMDGETGRLVPGCGHGFHADCIATWFEVNSACPLCRAAVTTWQGIRKAPRL